MSPLDQFSGGYHGIGDTVEKYRPCRGDDIDDVSMPSLLASSFNLGVKSEYRLQVFQLDEKCVFSRRKDIHQLRILPV